MQKLTIMFAGVLALSAFGCGKGSACDKAIAHSMELSKGDMAKMPGVDEKMMTKLRDIGVDHCKNDKWPDEAISCMNDAKAEADATACYGKLSADQREKMQKAAMAAMQSMAPAPAPTAPAAPAADTGSTGSAK
jgi:hypothetical protein